MVMASSGIGPADWLNVSVAFSVGFAAVVVAVVALVLQARWNRSSRSDAASVWQSQVEELSERLRSQSDAEIKRLVAQLADANHELRELRGKQAGSTADG